MDEEEQPRKRSKKSALVHYGSQGMGVGPSQETESELMASSLDLVRKKKYFFPQNFICVYFLKNDFLNKFYISSLKVLWKIPCSTTERPSTFLLDNSHLQGPITFGSRLKTGS